VVDGSNETEISCGEPDAAGHGTRSMDGRHPERRSQACSPSASSLGDRLAPRWAFRAYQSTNSRNPRFVLLALLLNIPSRIGDPLRPAAPQRDVFVFECIASAAAAYNIIFAAVSAPRERDDMVAVPSIKAVITCEEIRVAVWATKL